MDKLSHYIMHGKTNGTRFFLVFSLVLSLIVGGFFGLTLQHLPTQPKVRQLLADFPTVTIEDGMITSPVDTLWQSPGNESDITLTIDTRTTQPTPEERPDGIYLLQNEILLKSGAQIRTASWPTQQTVLTRETILKDFENSIPVAAMLLSVLVFAMLWLGLILTVLLTRFIVWLIRRSHPKSRITRAALVGWSAIISLDILLLFLNHGFSLLTALILGTCIATIGLFYGYSTD